MKKLDFEEIKKKADRFSHSSLNYTEYEDIADYNFETASDDLVLLCGYNTEAKCREYHWAADNAGSLAEHLKCETAFFITFIPKEWVHELEGAGLRVRNAWHDYFLSNLDKIDVEACHDADFLTSQECAQASEATQACVGQSRGFTGQTPEWIANWIGGANADVKNAAILVSRAGDGEIVGIVGLVCTGTYANESEKGPTAWIREAAVIPSYQNRGIARKLIMQALAYQKRNGATRAFLACDENNENAIHLYTSIGFLPSDEESETDMIKV